jgi:hypothetical protein
MKVVPRDNPQSPTGDGRSGSTIIHADNLEAEALLGHREANEANEAARGLFEARFARTVFRIGSRRLC